MTDTKEREELALEIQKVWDNIENIHYKDDFDPSTGCFSCKDIPIDAHYCCLAWGLAGFILEREKGILNAYKAQQDNTRNIVMAMQIQDARAHEEQIRRDERKKVAEEIHDRMLTLKGSSVGVLEVCDICEEVISSCEVQE